MSPQHFRVGLSWQRHVLVSAVGGLLASVFVFWLWPVDADAMRVAREDVVRLQSRLHQQQNAPRSTPSNRALVDEPEDPSMSEVERVWPWLQQRLQAQGFQIQTLRPQPLASGATLPEQAVSLRLQGQWRDWLDFEQALDAQAPWWVLDQWQVVPAGQVAGEVRIELQTRLGLRPPALGQPQAPRRWPEWPTFAGGLQPAGQVLFAVAQTPVASKSPTAALMPTDLRSRSAQDLRLLGIWHRADAAYAVFGDGLDHVTVTLGQRVGRDGYRVRRIAPDRVVLESTDAHAPVLDIKLQGDKP